MGNILENLWYGDIDPREQCTERNPAIKELTGLIERNRSRLHESITAEQQETLEKYDDCINELHDIVDQKIFSYAFRLGGKLMLAMILGDPDEEQ